jgi:hypothetical protein
MTEKINFGESTPAETPAPEGHAERMAAKYEEAQAKAGAPNSGLPAEEAERPAWLPEKFKTPEDLASAYAELSKKLGQGGAETPPATPPAETPGEPAQEAREAVEKAGLDFDAYVSEFAEKGALSAETYAALEKAGIPKAVVDGYVEGQVARAEKMTAEVQGVIGTAEEYQRTIQWAATNLSPAEVEAFNKAMDSGDLGQMKLAASGLKSRFETANGREPATNIQGGVTGPAVAPFGSRAEVTRAMNDPRYRTDEAYRAEVYRRLDATKTF